MGPRARDLVQSITEHDLSNEAFPYGTTQAVDFGSINARLFRISYIGDLGWEVYVPTEQGLPMWDRLWGAGQDFGVRGGRRRGLWDHGTDREGLSPDGGRTRKRVQPGEAGLCPTEVEAADFIGKEAYQGPRRGTGRNPVHLDDRGPHVANGTASSATRRDGNRSHPAGGAHRRWQGATLVCHHRGTGPSVGKYLLMAYLPPEHAVVDNDLAVMYMNELYPVKVAVAGSTPLFDPDDKRMKA